MKLRDEMFTVVSSDESHLQLRLNADHSIYKAHFPGNPITPGVCVVQIIGELLEEKCQSHLVLSRIVNLKFTALLSPLENPFINVELASVIDDDSEVRAKGTISTKDALATKFSLIFRKA